MHRSIVGRVQDGVVLSRHETIGVEFSGRRLGMRRMIVCHFGPWIISVVCLMMVTVLVLDDHRVHTVWTSVVMLDISKRRMRLRGGRYRGFLLPVKLCLRNPNFQLNGSIRGAS